MSRLLKLLWPGPGDSTDTLEQLRERLLAQSLIVTILMTLASSMVGALGIGPPPGVNPAQILVLCLGLALLLWKPSWRQPLIWVLTTLQIALLGLAMLAWPFPTAAQASFFMPLVGLFALLVGGSTLAWFAFGSGSLLLLAFAARAWNGPDLGPYLLTSQVAAQLSMAVLGLAFGWMIQSLAADAEAADRRIAEEETRLGAFLLALEEGLRPSLDRLDQAIGRGGGESWNLVGEELRELSAKVKETRRQVATWPPLPDLSVLVDPGEEMNALRERLFWRAVLTCAAALVFFMIRSWALQKGPCLIHAPLLAVSLLLLARRRKIELRGSWIVHGFMFLGGLDILGTGLWWGRGVLGPDLLFIPPYLFALVVVNGLAATLTGAAFFLAFLGWYLGGSLGTTAMERQLLLTLGVASLAAVFASLLVWQRFGFLLRRLHAAAADGLRVARTRQALARATLHDLSDPLVAAFALCDEGQRDGRAPSPEDQKGLRDLGARLRDCLAVLRRGDAA